MAKLRNLAEGAGPIRFSRACPGGRALRLVSVELRLATAPSTSELLTVTRESGAGDRFDVQWFAVDPSLESATQVVWIPDGELVLWPGDELGVAFANTDDAAWGLTVIFEGA